MLERLDALDVRIEALEERVGRVVGTVTRGRTTDIDRISALEKRVAELEALLQKPAQS